MHERNNTCCFTGHRKIPASELDHIKQSLNKALTSLIEKGITCFCAGGALGFDTLAAQTVLSLKEKYPHIQLILVLPCVNQSKSWNDEDKAVYEAIKKQSDEVIYTSEHYFRGCMQVRNRALVDRSCVAVCYLTESTGGTAYTVKYAKKNGLKVINLVQTQTELPLNDT